MLHPKLKNMLVADIEELMIPDENVACIYDYNTLTHAMLVLSQMEYAMVPVIDRQSKLLGLISIGMIIKEATSIQNIDMDHLEGRQVSQLSLREPATICLDEGIDSLIHKLMDNNFVCVIADRESMEFIGIITRNAVLKRLNSFLHLLNRYPELIKDISQIEVQTK